MSTTNTNGGMVQLRIRIDPEILVWFRAEAEKNGRTVSQIARTVIDRGRKSYKRAHRAA